MPLETPLLTRNFLPLIPASSLRPSSFGAPLPYHLLEWKQPGAIWERLKASGGFVSVATETCQGSLELIGVIIPEKLGFGVILQLIGASLPFPPLSTSR